MDKNKVLWHTIKLKIPSEMISIGKNGVMTVKQSLTKKNNISKRLKEPSVILESDPNITEAKIIDKGDIENVDDIKERQGKLKRIRKKLETLPNKPVKVSKEQLLKGLTTAPKKDDKNADDFNEWLNYLVKPLQDKQIWNTLTDKMKYYNYKNYKLHLEPTEENKNKIIVKFGKMYKLPENLNLLPEVIEYINSKPKKPAKWELGTYLDIQDANDKNKVMSRRRSTQESRIQQAITEASLIKTYASEINNSPSTHKMWMRGKRK
jgi:hypothetical protein